MSDLITLAHGAGGKQTAELIDRVFKAHFSNPQFTGDDAAVLPIGGTNLAFTTDGFIVSPPEFPGGNIGKLSICGTVNDLSCMGAKPLYLSCAFVIEEGFPMEKVEAYAKAMAETAAEAGVRIVAGDTKVAARSGRPPVHYDDRHRPNHGRCPNVGHAGQTGRCIIVSGDVGRHGCTILLERNQFGIDADVTSDCAPLWGTVESMLNTTKDIHVIRDATRGGVGTVLYEIAAQSKVGIHLDSQAIPVDPAVRGVCGMLGLEPLYLACEGRLVIVAPKEVAGDIVAVLKKGKYSQNAAIIGEVTEEQPGRVVMRTEIGAEMLLPPPGGELLPRIC